MGNPVRGRVSVVLRTSAAGGDGAGGATTAAAVVDVVAGAVDVVVACAVVVVVNNWVVAVGDTVDVLISWGWVDIDDTYRAVRIEVDPLRDQATITLNPIP